MPTMGDVLKAKGFPITRKELAAWRKKYLDALLEAEGVTLEEMSKSALMEGSCPAICTNGNCGYTTLMEPDQDRGWCEECNKGTVVSGLILAEVI
jgi:hypothetical protein